MAASSLVRPAPKPPVHLVARSELISNLRTGLLGTTQTHGLVGVSGMGGIGKTVLASMVCHDEAVIEEFGVDIHWIVVGQTPDLSALQWRLARRLGETATPFLDEGEGLSRLSALLDGRKVLLVLDDVWEQEHVEAFDVLDTRVGRLLLTTRIRGLLSGMNAVDHDVDVLTPDESLQLLSQWTNTPPDTLPAEAADVSKECGYLPLALAMVGAMAANRPSAWADVLDRLRASDLRSLRKKFPQYKYPDLLRSLHASVEALSSELRECYCQLAVFPPDTAIPESTLAILWNLTLFETRDTACQLEARSLLQRHETNIRADPSAEYAAVVTVHDLMMDYLIQAHPDLRSAHSDFVNAYLTKGPFGTWSIPDDGYVRGRLIAHCFSAELPDVAIESLTDYRWLRTSLSSLTSAEILTELNSAIDVLKSDTECPQFSYKVDTLRLLHDTLRLSAHVIDSNPDELASQLGARTTDLALRLGISDRRAPISFGPQRMWLSPRTPTLTSPESATVRTLSGHGGAINTIAITRDDRLISGATDGNLRVWDVTSGELLQSISAHSGWVLNVATSRRGNLVASSSTDGTAAVWDPSTWELLRVCSTRQHEIAAICLTDDEKHLFTGGEDGVIRMWSIETGDEVAQMSGHTDSVRSLALCSEGHNLVSASFDHTIRVWQLPTGREIAVLRGHTGEVNALFIDRGKNLVVSGGDDRVVRLWDLAGQRELGAMVGHRHWVQDVSISPDGLLIASASSDQTVKVWRLVDLSLVATYRGHQHWALSIAFTNDSRTLASGSFDQTVRLWDMSRPATPSHSPCHRRGISSIANTRCGRHVATASEDHTAILWDIDYQTSVVEFEGHQDELRSVCFTPDERRILTASLDHSVRVWDIPSGRELACLRGHQHWVLGVTVSPDGKRAASASADGTVRVWDLDTLSLLLTINAHQKPVTDVEISDDGRQLFSVSDDGTIGIWSLQTGRLLQRVNAHAAPMHRICVSSDAAFVVTCSADGTIRRYSVEGCEQPTVFQGHEAGVNDVAISSDDMFIVSVSDDHTVRVWRIADALEIARFTCEGFARSCCMSGRGTIAVGDGGGYMHCLDIREGMSWSENTPRMGSLPAVDSTEPSGTCDVFISHNSKDKHLVRELSKELTERGCSVWIDDEQIRPGESVQKRLEESLQQCNTSLVCIGPNGIGRWQKIEISALIRLTIGHPSDSNNHVVIPVILAATPRSVSAPLLLQDFSSVDLRADDSSERIASLVSQIVARR